MDSIVFALNRTELRQFLEMMENSVEPEGDQFTAEFLLKLYKEAKRRQCSLELLGSNPRELNEMLAQMRK